MYLHLHNFFSKGTPYVLLVEIFRSLVDVSDLFADVQHFDWLLEHALAVQKETAADDPPCLESSLVACIFKAAAFVSETVIHYSSLRIGGAFQPIRKLFEMAVIGLTSFVFLVSNRHF